MCHMEFCAEAQDKGLQFPNRFVDDNEDVIDAFKTIEVAMEQLNKEHTKATSKPNKRTCTKKSDVVVSVQKIGNKIATAGESSQPK